jgi:hypothetical protein
MNRYSLVAIAILLHISHSVLAGQSEDISSKNKTEKTRILHVVDGYYRQDLFRRVADDETDTGFAVLANPRYNTKTGRLAGNFYIRDIPPGQYRIIFRLKIGEIPRQPVMVFSWDINTDSMGTLNAGVFETSAFARPSAYQDIAVHIVVPQGVRWIDPRLFWQGKIMAWVDTITVFSAETPVPVFSRAGHTAEIDRLSGSGEPRPIELHIPRFRKVTKQMYRETGSIFFREIERTTRHWLKQPEPYPNISEYVEHIKWLAYMHHLTGNQGYARTAAGGIAQAYRLITEPRKDTRFIQPRWQEVAPLYFIDKWLDKSPSYASKHRAWVRNIALRAVPSFPAASLEYGAFNRAFLGAITGEALLQLVPNAPDADKWRKYKEQVWDYWWRFRDTDESSEHYNALWFRYLLQWVEMRGFEEQFWSDNKVKQLFERFLYQVFPMGSLPHYSDSPGWNVAWGHWVYLFEACATHYKDGRYKWAAHRIYDYSVNRIENISGWSYTGREAGWSLANAYSVADETIREKPRDFDIAVLTRHKATQRSEAARKATRQFFDLTPGRTPDKLVFYSGNDPDALSMMIDVIGAAGHGHARPPAIISLADHQSVLLMSLGYADRLPEHHNIPVLADYDGYPYDNTPYYIKSNNNLVKHASATDLGAAAYGRIQVDNYEGYPATLVREVVFIKNAGVLVKDTLTSNVTLRARWSPVYRVRNVGPEYGANWINTYLGEWIPVRGLQQNANVMARWKNSARDLLIYFLPRPRDRMEIVDERAWDKTLPLPLRVQHSQRQQLHAGMPVSSVALLVPHGPGPATPLADKIRVLLDRPRQTIVEFDDDDGISNLVILNTSGRALQTDDLVTDAEVACIRRRGKEVISVAMSNGGSLKFAGKDLSTKAPPPVSNLIPP